MLYDGTAPEQKTKSAKNSLDSMYKLFFNPSECNKLQPPSHLSVRSVLLHFVQRSPPETRTLYKGDKKVYLIPGSSKSGSFLGRGERNGVFIINFIKFIQTRNFFRRGAFYPLYRQSKRHKPHGLCLLFLYNYLFICFEYLAR